MLDIGTVGGFILGAVVSLIVISNPVSTSAVFLSLTDGIFRKDQREIAKRSVKFSLAILLFFAVTGLFIFKLFGFTIGAFRIAGGVLLFTLAAHMMNQKRKHHQEISEADYNEIALMPLSVPLTAGPGTIVTTVLLVTESLDMIQAGNVMNGLFSMIGIYGAIGILVIVSYFIMVNSQRIDKVVKEGGRHIITRLMGLLVMAIAIQFMINGVIDIIPDLVAAAA